MFTKHATGDILAVKKFNTRLTSTTHGGKLSSFDHLPSDTYRTSDGYVYLKVRAISSRYNKNYDGWPTQELAGMTDKEYKKLVSKLDEEDRNNSHNVESATNKTSRILTANKVATRGNYGFKTFIGKPIFVDHNNTDPERTRGVIVDSLLHIEPANKKYASNDYWTNAPDNHKPETWIELLLEIDAKQFPKLAKAVEAGDIDAVSMGANIEYTVCSICGNEAEDASEYCSHIASKGRVYNTQDKTASKKVAYEDCYGVQFFEISLVFDPADETALFTDKPKTSKWRRVSTTDIIPSSSSSRPQDIRNKWNVGERDNRGRLKWTSNEEPMSVQTWAQAALDEMDTQEEWPLLTKPLYDSNLAHLKKYADEIFEIWEGKGMDAGEEDIRNLLKMWIAQGDREYRPDNQVADIRKRWNVGERDDRGRLKWTRVAGVKTGERYEPGNGYYIADFYPAVIIAERSGGWDSFKKPVDFQTNLDTNSMHQDTFNTWLQENNNGDWSGYTYIRGLYNPDTKQLAMMNRDEFSRYIDDFVRLAVQNGLEVSETGVAVEKSYEERRDNPDSWTGYKFEPKPLPGLQTKIDPYELPGDKARVTKAIRTRNAWTRTPRFAK